MECSAFGTSPAEGRILVVDQGNSFVKAVLFHGYDVMEEERFELRAAEEGLARVQEWCPEGGIFCSVGEMDAKFVESLRRICGEDFQVFTHSTALPVQVDYRPYEGLGLDRVAAAVGACRGALTGPVLVADAGTAITADLVLPPGRFAGGSIAPGLRMRLEALHDRTARLPLLDVPDTVPPLTGDSTAGSMLSGCIDGAALELAGRCRALAAGEGGMPELMLTGGDALILEKAVRHLDPGIGVTVRPRLVAEGLLEIYRHNAENY